MGRKRAIVWLVSQSRYSLRTARFVSITVQLQQPLKISVYYTYVVSVLGENASFTESE